MVRPTHRPLTARSVIASTLLGVDPPRLPTLALVRSGELFGLTEGATRTALSRMAAAGEIEPDGAHYRLSGRLLERFHRQQSARTATGSEGDWGGDWILLAIRAERRSARERATFRDAALALHLVEMREGLWARPDNVDLAADADAYGSVSAPGTWIRGARPDDVDAFVAPFQVEAWAATARDLLEEMAELQPALDDGDTSALAAAFLVDAAVIRHLTADPVLPSPLLPSDWPGMSFRSAFAVFDQSVTTTWREWYQSFVHS